jgi:hypothetical protein
VVRTAPVGVVRTAPVGAVRTAPPTSRPLPECVVRPHARVAGGAPVDGGAAVRGVRGDVKGAGGVMAPLLSVGAARPGAVVRAASRWRRPAGRWPSRDELCVDDQRVEVVRPSVPGEAESHGGVVCLAAEEGLGVGARRVGLIRPLLAMDLHAGVAGWPRRSRGTVFRFEASSRRSTTYRRSCHPGQPVQRYACGEMGWVAEIKPSGLMRQRRQVAVRSATHRPRPCPSAANGSTRRGPSHTC